MKPFSAYLKNIFIYTKHAGTWNAVPAGATGMMAKHNTPDIAATWQWYSELCALCDF